MFYFIKKASVWIKSFRKLFGYTFRGYFSHLFIKFISEKPASDAYLDFEKWDAVIEKGFGGHKFIKF